MIKTMLFGAGLLAVVPAYAASVLASRDGDGDFALLAERLIGNYQTEVEVYGVPSLTAQALVNAASRFIAIERGLLLR